MSAKLATTIRCELGEAKVFMVHVFVRDDGTRYGKLIVAHAKPFDDDTRAITVESTSVEEDVEAADVRDALVRFARAGYFGSDFLSAFPAYLGQYLH